MKNFLCILLSVLPFLSFASDVYVQGYTRKDGTHVEGHYRSAPNSTTADNFSTYGNINPYTGELGTKRFNESNDSSSSYNNYQENRQSVEHSMLTGTCNTNDAESFSIEFNNDVLIAKGKYKARRSESDSNAWAFYSNKGYSYYLGNLNNSGKIPIKVSNKWGLNTRGLCTVN